jgi:hypothetical protein
MTRGNLLGLILLLPALASADPASVTEAGNTVGNARSSYGSAEAIQQNFTTPLMSADAMKTFDGQGFDASLGCTGSQKFLEIFVAPSGSGDIGTLSISQDTNLDGTVDHIFTPGVPVSGVCANGAVSCDAGTWDNCSGLAWVVNGAGEIGMTPTPLSKLGGCYCVNDSCGSGLVMSNLDKVLNDLGGGATGALTSQLDYLTVSEVGVSGPMIQFYAQKAGDCAAGSPMLKAYKSAPGNLASDAFTNSATDQNFSLITTSSAASADPVQIKSCQITRNVPVEEVTLNDIIQYASGSGNVFPCGPDCLQLSLGQVGDNYWAGSCKMFERQVQFNVLDPSRILEAKINYAKFDDWMQIYADADLLWNGPYGNWTGLGRPPGACELSTNWVRSLNVDFKNYLTGGPVDFKIRVEVTGNGEGYALAKIKVDTDCKLDPDTISDSCTAYQNDPDCTLMEEQVDGVWTRQNFVNTGLSPLPSTQVINGSTCSFTPTRPWWQKSRKYRCQVSGTYDFDDALERVDNVQATTTPTGYQDYLKQANGSVLTPAGAITTLEEVTVPACTQACKTRKPRLATDAVQNGVVQENRTDPNTFDYFFHECSAGVCPAGPGETVVQACGCLNEFSEAAATLQAVRQASRDTICSSGTTNSL